MSAQEPRIVIADDDESMRKLLSFTLSRMGYTPAGEAATASAALQLYSELQPDILLLDVLFPDGSGIDVLRSIIQQDPDAVVVMLSALDDEDIAEKCIGLGASAFIQKQTPAAEMKQIIGDLLENK